MDKVGYVPAAPGPLACHSRGARHLEGGACPSRNVRPPRLSYPQRSVQKVS